MPRRHGRGRLPPQPSAEDASAATDTAANEHPADHAACAPGRAVRRGEPAGLLPGLPGLADGSLRPVSAETAHSIRPQHDSRGGANLVSATASHTTAA